MATRPSIRPLDEPTLYAPDLDEGELDVEHYPIPSGEDIADQYLSRVWKMAQQTLDAQSGDRATDESATGKTPGIWPDR